MSQSEFALLGESIAAEINTALSITTAAHRRKTVVERRELDADTWRVDVIQKSHEARRADRTSRYHLYTYDIVFRRPINQQAAEAAEVDPLCEEVELAEDELWQLEPTVNGNDAACTASRREPPFDPDALAGGVFLAVITATWELQR